MKMKRIYRIGYPLRMPSSFRLSAFYSRAQTVGSLMENMQIGSVVLFGLYLVVKFLGVEWINWLLGWYFTIAGVGSVWKARCDSFLMRICHALTTS